MLQIINSTEKLPYSEIEKRYPDSKCVISKEKGSRDDIGCLIAVSTSLDSYKDLCDFVESLPKNLSLDIIGLYKEA